MKIELEPQDLRYLHQNKYKNSLDGADFEIITSPMDEEFKEEINKFIEDELVQEEIKKLIVRLAYELPYEHKSKMLQIKAGTYGDKRKKLFGLF